MSDVQQASWGLDALTQPLGALAFLERCWPREIFVGHGPLERLGGLGQIGRLSSVEALLGATTGLVRVWPPLERRNESAVLVLPDAALRLYREGWTVYLNQAERWVPELLPFIRRIEADLGLHYGVVATEVFASNSGAGARPHCDFDFGFNIQLRGRKAWRLAPNTTVSNPHTSVTISDPFDREVAAYCAGEMPRDMPTNACNFVAEPGSVVFVPRGCWHSTMAEEPSFALTFACKGKMWSQLLMAELESILRQRERWREFPAPLCGISAGVLLDNVTALEGLLRDFRDVVSQLVASELVDKWNSAATAVYRISPVTKPQLLTGPVSGISGVCLSLEQIGNGRRLLAIPAEHVAIVTAVVSSTYPIAAPDLAQLLPCSLDEAELTIEALVNEGVLERV
jgi:50S ribosomal protein L16 3-hydroxylase